MGPRKQFGCIEYSSFYAVRHNATGDEQPMSDGVDALFTRAGKPMSPGSEYFRRTWERSLNENPGETLEAYFPQHVQS